MSALTETRPDSGSGSERGSDAPPPTVPSPTHGSTWSAPPRWLVAVAALVALTTTALGIVGAWQTGMSWDEAYHVERMRNYLGTGWYLLDGDLTTSTGEPGWWEDQAYVYAPLTAILMHLAAMLAGAEGGGEIAASGQAYAVRHLVIVTIGLIGLGAAAHTTRRLTGSWGWGLVTAAVLGAIPMWTGHTMFNVKDVPVATGCTLVTAGLILLVTGHRDRTHVATGAGIATATVVTTLGWLLAVGTRPGIWPTLVASHAVAVAILTLTRAQRRLLVGAIVPPLAAWVVLLAVYPAVFSTPRLALWESAMSSSRFDDRVGQWFYVPALLVGETPLLLLVAFVVGTLAALRRALTALRSSDAPDRMRDLAWTLVGVQALTLPLLAMVRESNLYNGLRQLLFMVPAMAVLATLGIAVATAAARRSGRRPLALGVAAVVAVGVVGPTLAQVRLFPYGYTFATWPSYAVPEAADTDYWRTAARELAPEVPADGWVTCSPALTAERHSQRRSLDGDEDCAYALIGPLSPYADERGPEVGLGPTEFWAITAGPRRAGTNCAEVATVSRPGPLWGLGALVGMPERDVMTRLSRCELVLEDRPDGELTFGPGGNGGQLELGGWSAHAMREGIGLDGSAGQIGFAVAPNQYAAGAELVVETTAPVTLAVNGVRLEVDESGVEGGVEGERTAQVPASALAAYGDGRVVISIGRADADSVRLLALDLTPTPIPTSESTIEPGAEQED